MYTWGVLPCPCCGKAEVWFSLLLCSNSKFWWISGEIRWVLVKLWWNPGRSCSSRTARERERERAASSSKQLVSLFMYGSCNHFDNLHFKQSQNINHFSAAHVVVSFQLLTDRERETGRNRFGSVRFGSGFLSKINRLDSVWFDSVPRLVPAGSRIRWFGSFRFGSADSVRFLIPSFLPSWRERERERERERAAPGNSKTYPPNLSPPSSMPRAGSGLPLGFGAARFAPPRNII